MQQVSLYIPLYNAAKTIQDCIRAVCAQTYPIEEILVIDDGSTDASVDLLTSVNVTLVQHKKNRGLSCARNTALQKARNNIIAALDADCIPHETWLEELMKYFSDDTIAAAGGRVEEDEKQSLGNMWRIRYMPQHWGNEVRFNPPFLFGSNTCMRREVLVDLGGYPETHKTNYEDVYISKKLKDAGHIIVYTPQATVKHMKEDTVYSAMKTYWFWQASIDEPSKQTPLKICAACVSQLFRVYQSSGRVIRKDLHDKQWGLAIKDLQMPFLLMWWWVKRWIQRIIPRL